MAEFFALTRKEKAALARLSEMHNEFPSNDYGFLAGDMGSGNAAACRRLEATGLVTINRIAENCFRYSLSETGKARFDLPAPQRETA